MAENGKYTVVYEAAGKKAEWDDYRTKVSQWEIDKYIMNYQEVSL